MGEEDKRAAAVDILAVIQSTLNTDGKLTDLRLELARYHATADAERRDAKHKANNAHKIATTAAAEAKSSFETLKRLEPTVSNQALAIQETNEAKAKSNEARTHMLGHIAEIRAWQSKVMWWIIALLIGMLGTTIGWIATLVLKG